MTKLIEKKGKKYIIVNVETSKTAQASHLGFLSEPGAQRRDLRCYPKKMPIFPNSINMHLYFTMFVKEINVGDFILDNGITSEVTHVGDMFITLSTEKMIKKQSQYNLIIASSDDKSSRGITSSFLKAYASTYINSEIKRALVLVDDNGDIHTNKLNQVSTSKNDLKANFKDGEIYSLESYDNYKMRYKFTYEVVGTDYIHNLDLYSSCEDKDKVRKLFEAHLPISMKAHNVQMIHTSSKEQDDITAQFINETLNNF